MDKNRIIIIRMISIVTLGMGIMLVEVGGGRAPPPVLHEVGGDRNGWRLDVNFSDWAATQIFYVGDWLYFGFDKNKMSVLEVNQTGYENCNESNYITNITRGGRDVFNLTAARPYYFISGRGYCYRGIKLAIKVQDAPPPTPPSNNSDSIITKNNNTSTTFTSHAATSSLFQQPSDHFIIMITVVVLSGIYVTWSLLN